MEEDSDQVKESDTVKELGSPKVNTDKENHETPDEMNEKVDILSQLLVNLNRFALMNEAWENRDDIVLLS